MVILTAQEKIILKVNYIKSNEKTSGNGIIIETEFFPFYLKIIKPFVYGKKIWKYVCNLPSTLWQVWNTNPDKCAI